MDLRVAGPNDVALFENVHEDVFDDVIQPDLLRSYLADPRLHLVVAINDGQIIGMVSGMHYHHPDKPPEMWLNELGVAEPFRRRGIATALVRAMGDVGRDLNCTALWVLADPTDMAEGFYTSLGWERMGDRLAMFTGAL